MGMGYYIEVEKWAMVGYDSRYAVKELLCNRSLADVLYCDYTVKLKWIHHIQLRTWALGMGQTGEKKYTVFVDVKMEQPFFFGFIIFIFFILSMCHGGL